jgi:hypothetical protein
VDVRPEKWIRTRGDRHAKRGGDGWLRLKLNGIVDEESLSFSVIL